MDKNKLENELIRKGDVFALLEAHALAYGGLAHEIANLEPVTDVKPVQHGRWILEREPDGTPYCLHCSACDDDFRHIDIMSATLFCPNCGAYMDCERIYDVN